MNEGSKEERMEERECGKQKGEIYYGSGNLNMLSLVTVQMDGRERDRAFQAKKKKVLSTRKQEST